MFSLQIAFYIFWLFKTFSLGRKKERNIYSSLSPQNEKAYEIVTYWKKMVR